jgi:hypothetical protein
MTLPSAMTATLPVGHEEAIAEQAFVISDHVASLRIEMTTDQLVTPSTVLGYAMASLPKMPSCVSNDPTRYTLPSRPVSMAVPGAVATDEVVASGSSIFATCNAGRTTNEDAATVVAGEFSVLAGSVVVGLAGCDAESEEEEQLAKARELRSRALTKVRESFILNTVQAEQLLSRNTTALTGTDLD